ncbi:hypothetical protein BDQ17DRAFT_1338975 [Cyathus striatus]|nr:hypothetical protein BDQ17DRAFT_1338975 [Cyathus striatus]
MPGYWGTATATAGAVESVVDDDEQGGRGWEEGSGEAWQWERGDVTVLWGHKVAGDVARGLERVEGGKTEWVGRRSLMTLEVLRMGSDVGMAEWVWQCATTSTIDAGTMRIGGERWRHERGECCKVAWISTKILEFEGQINY